MSHGEKAKTNVSVSTNKKGGAQVVVTESTLPSTTRRRRGTKKKGQAPSQQRKEKRIQKAISRPLKAYSTMEMYANSMQEARAVCEKAIISFLMGESSFAKGFLYARDDQHPVLQRLLPFTKVLTSSYFDEQHGLAFSLRPNPYRTLEIVQPPLAGNKGKDTWESIQIATHYANPTSFCFDHDITCIRGSISASTHVVTGLPPLQHYAASTSEFKDGNKIYASGPSTFPSIPAFSVNNVATYDVNYNVEIFKISQSANGPLEVAESCDTAFVLGSGGTQVAAVGNNAAAWMNAMALPDTYGFAIVITVSSGHGDSNVTSGNGSSVSISLSGASENAVDQPTFGSSYTYEIHEIWDLIGPQSRGLQVELTLADQIAVTGYSLLLSNYTAPLNKAGRVMGAQVPTNHTVGLPLAPAARLESLTTFPTSVYKMTEPMLLDNGCHYSNVATPVEAAFLARSAYENFRQATHNKPYAAVAVDGKGAFNDGTNPNLQLRGALNVEWRSTSMTLPPRIPPRNIGMFGDVLAQCLSQLPSGSLWGENPKHFDKIKKTASKIVKNPLFKTVIRDIALVGVESLAAVFLV